MKLTFNETGDVPAPRASFPNDFDEGAFAAAAVKFAVEDLLPGTEVQFAFGDGDDDFAAHDLAFHVGVGVVLAGAVVAVLGGWRVRREFFQPDIVVVEQTVLGVVDEDRGGDVHGVDEAKAFRDAAFADEFGDGAGDVDEAAAIRDFKPKMFGQRFHGVVVAERGRGENRKWWHARFFRDHAFDSTKT